MKILEYNPDVNLKTKSSTPLHDSLYLDIKYLKALINKGVNVNLLKPEKNKSALHFCIKKPDHLKLLLENKANPEVTDHLNMTPLEAAKSALAYYTKNNTPIASTLEQYQKCIEILEQIQ